ncbi:hypothetical protein [Actinophytocola sp.]|uniref:hypothetical protein n=1 Tax=Actinophytocola sp. TaxID=1872138 RepID=UPI002ED3EE19
MPGQQLRQRVKPRRSLPPTVVPCSRQWNRQAQELVEQIASAAVCRGLECLGIGEPGPVVADLGEHTRPGQSRQSRKAGDDLDVRVSQEDFLGRGGQLFDSAAGGDELLDQRGGLAPIAFSIWVSWRS